MCLMDKDNINPNNEYCILLVHGKGNNNWTFSTFTNVLNHGSFINNLKGIYTVLMSLSYNIDQKIIIILNYKTDISLVNDE